MFDETQAGLAPYNTAGQAAINPLLALAGAGPGGIKGEESALQQTPGYQFNLTQGLKAVQNSAAARGLGVSGAALKGASNYATGLADSTSTSQFNKLLSTAQLGEQAGAQTGQFATATGQGIAGSQIGQGNAAASGALGVANGASQVGNAGLNYYLLNPLISSLSQSSNGGTVAQSGGNF